MRANMTPLNLLMKMVERYVIRQILLSHIISAPSVFFFVPIYPYGSMDGVSLCVLL
jgi:hypothetical protein